LRKKAYAVQADVWLSAEGQVTRVELAKSSGDAETDAQVLAALRCPMPRNAPASVTPVRLSLKGRRPE
jgi:TonB family protein